MSDSGDPSGDDAPEETPAGDGPPKDDAPAPAPGAPGAPGGEDQAMTPPSTCCPMRRKVVVGILGVLPEQQCGVGDAELADFLRFDLQTPDGKPVLAFRYCPWCGAARGPDTEFRIVDVGFVGGEGEDDEDEDGFEPPSSSFEPPSFDPGPRRDDD